MSGKVVRIVGVLGILWNLGGVFSYLGHVGMLGGEPGPTMPVWVTAAFAIGVWAGLAGSVGLAMLKRWSAPVLWLSFVAAVINWGWVLAYSEQASVPLGATVMVLSLLLAVVASRTRPRDPAIAASA